jgi:acyl-CoA thioesterase
MGTMPSDLALASAVQKLDRAPGWYVADLPEDWSYVTPSGGVLMTVAMRAMTAELADPSLRPVSANTLFCSPVPAGPLEIRVEVLRRGGAAAQLRAALSSTRQPGPGLEVSATYARDRQGPGASSGGSLMVPDVYGIEPPRVPPPSECPEAGSAPRANAGRSPRRFFDNFDMALALGAPIWTSSGWSGGEARWACWYRYRAPQRDAAGMLDPLAIPPIADTMPGALANRIGPQYPFTAPSLDLTVHFLDPSDSEWILVDTRCQRARVGYATADAELWDDRGRLVAHATQTMILRKRR